MWHTIDIEYAIGTFDDASVRIIGVRTAEIDNKRQAELAECRALVAAKIPEGLKPIVKGGRIKGWRPRRENEAADDNLFGANGPWSR
jgi:hypothetical protein